MGSLAPLLESFFTQRLLTQRDASPHTIAAYRDAFRLFLTFAHARTGKPPVELDIEDINVDLVGAFLDHLQRERGSSARTRNARLTAIRSLLRYASFDHPEHGATIQRVLALPTKRTDHPQVTFLTEAEVDALLASPDRSTRLGRRDHALLVLDVQTGLRVSELISLRRQDVHLATGAYVTCLGKGRKQRSTPLTRQTVAVLRTWLREAGDAPADPLFPGPSGKTLSRDAVRRLVTRHVHRAQERCPSLMTKTISPHTLRHTAAMRLLHAGIDTSVIALWLGHEQPRTTQIYLHADLTIKERALDRVTPPNTTPGRYRAPDELLAFLESL